MLNHEKLFKELAQTTATYCVDYAREKEQARALWHIICNDVQAAHMICSQEWPYLVPRWHDGLGNQIKVDATCGDYSVFAVDGSQIYPDRHQGMACYLINIGIACVHYSAKSSARFDSQPFLMTSELGLDTPDFVNCQRTEFEFRAGLETALKQIAERPLFLPVFLFDGSLIFWHLDSKDEALKNRFLQSYCAVLRQFYEHRIVHAGYISLPKSRELINILRVVSELPNSVVIHKMEREKFMGNFMVDSDVIDFFLAPYCRTIIFENRSSIVNFYPSQLKPYFFYLNNGVEVVRIEIPAWIAHEPALVDRIASIILNQSLKGNGYPVCLAEAHEQAVVTNADRDLFYQMLQKSMFKNNGMYPVSQKSMHKRVLSI